MLMHGKPNSLGEVPAVIDMVLTDHQRLPELYDCLFNDDAWVRMRAADALEKICRVHPDWLEPYVDKFSSDLATSTQPSIQWHMAQIYRQVTLTPQQQHVAIKWLKQLVSTPDVDWIVSANVMDTLTQFTAAGLLPVSDLISLLKIQQHHKSPAVIKRATKYLDKYS